MNISEIDVSSIIAVGALLFGACISYRNYHDLCTQEGSDLVIVGYLGMLALFTTLSLNLLIQLLLINVVGISPFFSKVISSILSITISLMGVLFLDTWEFGKNKQLITSFLGESIIQEKRWVVGAMFLVLATPFVGIFALQSDWVYGVYWLVGVVLVFLLANIVTHLKK